MTKPLKTKLIEGDIHKGRHNEQPQASGSPKKPRGLGKYGAVLWDQLVPELYALGIVTNIDQPSLQGLCYWWDIYRRSADSLEAIEDFSSTDAQRAFNAVQRSWNEFRRLAQQFGLTACSRNGISITPQEDEFGDFLSGGQ